MRPTSIALVDDHTLFRSAIEALIRGFGAYTVIFEANNGEDFIRKINKHTLPDMAIIDLNMPGMNGLQTMNWISRNHPEIKVIILSMGENEKPVLELVRSGIRGYLLKDANPEEFKKAMETVRRGRYYFPDFITQYTAKQLRSTHPDVRPFELSDREAAFVQLCLSDKTYREIADEMHLSLRTIDGYRDRVFEKFGVKSRIGIIVHALKNKIIEL